MEVRSFQAVKQMTISSKARYEMALAAGGRFDQIVGLPIVVASGSGLQGAPFMTAKRLLQGSSGLVLVNELACFVREEAMRVGAVRLHVLTPCTLVMDTHGSQVNYSEVFWEGVFELADGSFHSPELSKGRAVGGYWTDGTL